MHYNKRVWIYLFINLNEKKIEFLEETKKYQTIKNIKYVNKKN